MRVEFRKISKEESPFTKKIDNLTVTGYMKKLRDNEVKVSLNINGILKHNCDSCGKEFDLVCLETPTLLISDGEYKGSQIDVIESFDHYIDIDYIIKSEIEAFKSDYHYCDLCENKFKE